jgi:hypothetical protein
MFVVLSGKTALENNLVAYIDVQDWYVVSQHRWHARKDGNTFYAATRRPRPHTDTEFITMHQLVAGRMKILSPEQPEVDHKDRNGLNNCRENLRAANRSQNAHNRKARGYFFDGSRKKNPFRVQTGGKHGRYIGRFATKEEAIEAYNKEKERVSKL